ncbi:TetR/AcrR family transcriptional regulator [Rhodococcus sp. SGAir0479]|uniref:TetR/AcrR family transcriptional regulator n=1 Tax=Rhodococcus sp. SGAir0479 TaxID=2567884 RepID=UPI0010CCFE94|nr:TetR/AcrR family transcriptional regulator [Rhodococcus sp. SGAir0479]QCQ90023.1 TetR/AcrR family transcriptional regulator [Rhodococcus sp. SGAir0479]
MTSRAQDLRPGAIRERILDAAEACLVESGYSSRLHAVIAERAGLSRPTVYKYVGDQSDIFEALLQREITRFFAVLDPVLHARGDVRSGFVDCVVFAVGYARRHAVLQKGLRDHPALVLPWFSVAAGPLIDRGAEFLVPHFERMLAGSPGTGIGARAAGEWAFRVVASLITTRGAVDTGDERALREFVHGLLSIGGVPASETQSV